MKRMMFLLLALSLILPVAAIATGGDVYIKDIDMVLTVDPSWICITKQTEAVDLQGTAFDSPAMQTLIDGEIQNVKATDNLHASILAVDDEVGLYSVQITSLQDEGTEALWDLSLYSEEQIEEEMNGSGASFELYQSKNDTYIVMENFADGVWVLGYTAVNNGRSVQIGLYFVGDGSDDQFRQVGEQFLSAIQFTQKAPRQSSDAGTGFFGTIWSMFKGFAISELSLLGRGLFWMAVFAIGYGVIILFAKLFDRRK